jgi:hypothetical protein
MRLKTPLLAEFFDLLKESLLDRLPKINVLTHEYLVYRRAIDDKRVYFFEQRSTVWIIRVIHVVFADANPYQLDI